MKSSRLTYFLGGITCGLLIAAFAGKSGGFFNLTVPVALIAALVSQERDARLRRRTPAAAEEIR